MHGTLVGASIRIHQVNFMSSLSLPPTDTSYWVVPGKILAGAYPGDLHAEAHERKIRALVDAGVRRFVSLMEIHETNYGGQPFVPYEELAQSLHPQVACLRFPIRDETVPSPETLGKILDALDQMLADEQTLYVHCWGGKGRTGTVIGCWLMRHGLATCDNVLDELARMRAVIAPKKRGDSPNTPAQRKFLVNWRPG
jgi:protein-tyrosine phosphatase